MKALFTTILVAIMLLCAGFAPGFSSYEATAYCTSGRTASGHRTQSGTIAADPRVLKIGTRVHIRAGKYSGEYVVHDTGSRIKGRRIDVFLKTRKDCLTFGKRCVKLRVL